MSVDLAVAKVAIASDLRQAVTILSVDLISSTGKSVLTKSLVTGHWSLPNTRN